MLFGVHALVPSFIITILLLMLFYYYCYYNVIIVLNNSNLGVTDSGKRINPESLDMFL